MFNWKKTQKIATKPEEKYLREDGDLGPQDNKGHSIWEKELPHRDGYEQTITEDQINAQKSADMNSMDAKVIEKVLNEAKSSYMKHRDDTTWLSVPPMAALVEKMRQARLEKDWDVMKKPHWSQTTDEKKQQGALPKWPKQAPQHKKPVLNNDPQRFTSLKANDTQLTGGKIKPLVGNITTADVHRIADGIKKGETVDYDTAILAILKQADAEKRELTSPERKAVVDLKIARTKSLMTK